jgi:hypothetical protein
VIARGEGDDAAAALVGGQLEQGIHRAADLERPGALQVFALQTHLDPHSLRERTARKQGGAVDPGADAFGGGEDVS